MSRLLLTALVLLGVTGVVPSPSANVGPSRVYVTLYPCGSSQNVVIAAGAPEVHLYDQAFYGDPKLPPTIDPAITITNQTADAIDFYFDVKPGTYDAFISLPIQHQGSKMGLCGGNGPLDVLSGKDRHLLVAAMSGITDWHLPGVVAGNLPMRGVDVSVLVYPHPMHCGDDVNWYGSETPTSTETPRKYDAVIDDGAYYANIHSYGKQNRTVALRFSGALFTSGTILLTVTPDTNQHKPPFIEKDITADILRAATASPFRQVLACVDGF